jgi:IS30 family transposase
MSPSVFKNKNGATRIGHCANAASCNKTKNCGPLDSCFSPTICKLLKTTYALCNCCPKFGNRSACRNTWYYYDPVKAQEESDSNWSDSRRGINLNDEELSSLNETLTSAVKDKNQSLYHCQQANKNNIKVCLKTLYRYIDIGALDVKNIDLPLKVRRRYTSSTKRKQHEASKEAVRKYFVVNRAYSNFQDYKIKNKRQSVVELDTVVGCHGNNHQVFLTMYFRDYEFMYFVYMKDRTGKSTSKAFKKIRDKIGEELYSKYFAIILSDNGVEFSNPFQIECSDETGERLVRMFYCDPYTSCQRGKQEKMHTVFRKLYPKGTSFEGLSAPDLMEVNNNVNSYIRKSLGGLSSYDYAANHKALDFLTALGIKKIDPKEVNMKKRKKK